jgi:hypothetical protein
MIKIRPSPTADTRTCDFSKVTRDTLLQSSVQHIADVAAGMRFLAEKMDEAARRHDHDKITAIDHFHADFATGFKQTGWWDNHRKVNRHHLTEADGIPSDVSLIDVLDFIVDCTMAGMARSGSVRPLTVSDEVLRRAFENTAALLLANVEVDASAPSSSTAPRADCGATMGPDDDDPHVYVCDRKAPHTFLHSTGPEGEEIAWWCSCPDCRAGVGEGPWAYELGAAPAPRQPSRLPSAPGPSTSPDRAAMGSGAPRQPSEPLAELAAMSPEEMSRRLREAPPAKPDPEIDRIRQQFVDGQHARANPFDFIGSAPARQPSDTDTAAPGAYFVDCGCGRGSLCPRVTLEPARPPGDTKGGGACG